MLIFQTNDLFYSSSLDFIKMKRTLGLYFNCSEWDPNESRLVYLCSCITELEMNRINRYIHKKDFKLGLIGQLLVLYGVSEFLVSDWKSVKIERNHKGRPFLKNKTDLVDFNLSHNGDFAVFVINSFEAIGVDVMYIDTKSDKETLFEHFKNQFNDEEWKQIYLNKDYELVTFYRLWCLKESLLKCIGIGLEFDLMRIKFILCSSLNENQITCDSVLFIDHVRLTKYKFQEQLIENHIFTVCRESDDNQTIEFLKIDENIVLKKAQKIGATFEKQWEFYQSKNDLNAVKK